MSSSFGLYVGTENVDIVSLSGSFQRPKLNTFARSRLPEESSWRSQVRVEGPEAPAAAGETAQGSHAVAQVIQTLLPKLGLSTAQAFVAIPAESVVIRYFQMPAIPAHERKMAIAFEAKKYLPFKLEELITDYEVISRRSDPALMRVMFFGIKKSSVAAYLSLFQTSAIQASCLEPAPISLIRLLRHTGQLPAGQVAAILHMERDSATISIARDDLLYLSRNVSMLPTGDSPAETAPDLLDALVNETRVSIDYYRRRFLGEPAVQKLILFAPEEGAKRVSELAAALDLPVEAGNSFGKITGATAIPAGLAVATGLALRGLDKRPREINLLPLEMRKQFLELSKPLVIESAAALLVLALWYGLSMADLQTQKNQLAAARSGQAWPEGISLGASIADLQQIRANREKESKLLKILQDSPSRPSQLLNEMSRLLPQESWLQYALFRESLLTNPFTRRLVLRLIGDTFSGDRDGELKITNEFLASLRSSSVFAPSFLEFSLDAVQRVPFRGENVTEFSITCATHAEDLKKNLDPYSPRNRRP